MGTPATKRLANYQEGLDPQRAHDLVLAKKPTMINLEGTSINVQHQVEELTHAVLASEGAVTSIQIPAYLAFSKEIMALKHRFSGGAQLDGAVSVILAKWKARYLTEAVLIRIRNEVHGIPAPAAP